MWLKHLILVSNNNEQADLVVADCESAKIHISKW